MKEVKKFKEVIKDVNEGLVDKWKDYDDSDSNLEVNMLLDIMKKLDEIDAKLTRTPVKAGPLGPLH